MHLQCTHTHARTVIRVSEVSSNDESAITTTKGTEAHKALGRHKANEQNIIGDTWSACVHLHVFHECASAKRKC